MSNERIPVKDLSAECVSFKSQEAEWDSGQWEPGGFNGWEWWEGEECNDCGEVYVSTGGAELHSDADPESDCKGYVYGEGPMMMFLYPLPPSGEYDREFDPDEAAAKLAGLPLCVVRVDDQYGLALTGGGMDFSWEICEAYTCLGYLPPYTFCDLPAMSNRGKSERDRYIIDACRASCQVLINWTTGTQTRLEQFGEAV